MTGTARYTFALDVPGLLHMKLLRSPHPHARILAIDTAAALRVPGVHLVLTHHDAPERLYSNARHEHPTEDPDGTRLLDDTVRYIGQRVAAVVADSEAAAEEGCRRIEVTQEILVEDIVALAVMRFPGVEHHRPRRAHDQPRRRGGGPGDRQLRSRPVPPGRPGRDRGSTGAGTVPRPVPGLGTTCRTGGSSARAPGCR
ncbi:hypothetical protein [Streptomyces arboris]|uniref:hypothetical protein n=1 Tax=Streptomyces arboris TaxID=2600619 RepID=UPI00384BC3C2